MRSYHMTLRRALGLVLAVVAFVVCGSGAARATDSGAPAGLHFVGEARPKALPPLRFSDASGRAVTLGDFRGKLVLLNIWATWCPGCREEIGSLDRLQEKLGGAKFQVVAISVDQGGAATVSKFFSKVHVRALKVYLNPSISVPNTLGVFGIPTSYLVDAKGQEIGKVLGPAAWDSPAVLTWLQRYLPRADLAAPPDGATATKDATGGATAAK